MAARDFCSGAAAEDEARAKLCLSEQISRILEGNRNEHCLASFQKENSILQVDDLAASPHLLLSLFAKSLWLRRCRAALAPNFSSRARLFKFLSRSIFLAKITRPQNAAKLPSFPIVELYTLWIFRENLLDGRKR